MPTYEVEEAFWRDWTHLSLEQRKRFLIACDKFVTDLKAGGSLRSGFKIEKYERQDGVWEFYFEGNGRALFSYGATHVAGEPHIIWLRIGTHKVYK